MLCLPELAKNTPFIKKSGYSNRNKLGSHQEISKSKRMPQKAMACNPEQKVSARDTSANGAQFGFCWRHKYTLVRPLALMNKSNGKNDQFHADKIGLL